MVCEFRERERESENEGVENEHTYIHREITRVYAIRAPNCCRRVTGDYFLIAAIKREQDHHASVRALSAFDVRELMSKRFLNGGNLPAREIFEGDRMRRGYEKVFGLED